MLVRQSAPLAGRPDAGVSIKELYDYRDQASDFDSLVEYHQTNFDLLNRGEPDRVSTGVVSHNFFDVLGITPIRGRTFVEGDDRPGADAVLVLSYSYWQKKFGGDPNIVGQVFQMNDRPHTVVGVLPNVPHYPQENDVYMSVSACPFRAAAEKQVYENRRAFSILTVFGHLKPGVSRERAASDVTALSGRFTRENPKAYRAGSGFTATTLSVQDEMTRNARPLLVILLGTTGLILLIACANVANLTLARLLRRDRELALSTALGANRARLIRQLLTESTLLALAGGVVGVLFAASTVGMLTTFIGRFTVRTGEVGIDPGVLMFTLGVSVLTGLVFGTFPALASRVDLLRAMKQEGSGGSGGRHRLQSALIVAQVAVSVTLLVGAGLLLASFYRLQKVDPGYHSERVLSADASVAVTNAVPLSTLQPGSNPFLIEGHAIDDPDKAMTRYWERSNPLGTRVSFDSGKTWATVIGVVGDVKQFGLSKDAVAQVYGPLSQAANGIGGGRVLVRTSGDPLSAAKIIREDVHAIDPNMPVVNVRTLDEIRDRYLATPRLTAVLLSLFAALAMLVTMTGITGVIATSVSQRTQEFGVRMALGASRERVLRMVIRQGLALVVAGLLLGIGASLALTRVLSTLLFDTTPTDPLTFAGVVVAFVLATTVDPMQALRAD